MNTFFSGHLTPVEQKKFAEQFFIFDWGPPKNFGDYLSLSLTKLQSIFEHTKIVAFQKSMTPITKLSEPIYNNLARLMSIGITLIHMRF